VITLFWGNDLDTYADDLVDLVQHMLAAKTVKNATLKVYEGRHRACVQPTRSTLICSPS
jgi:hypothetical protein